MNYINEAEYSIRLVRDVELKYTQSGKAVGNVSGAVTVRNYKDTEGNWQTETAFLDFEIWDSGAERFAERFQKGNSVLVKCTTKQDRWETAEGQKRSKVIFRINSFFALDENRSRPEPQTEAAGVANGEPTEDDIPF